MEVQHHRKTIIFTIWIYLREEQGCRIADRWWISVFSTHLWERSLTSKRYDINSVSLPKLVLFFIELLLLIGFSLFAAPSQCSDASPPQRPGITGEAPWLRCSWWRCRWWCCRWNTIPHLSSRQGCSSAQLLYWFINPRWRNTAIPGHSNSLRVRPH